MLTPLIHANSLAWDYNGALTSNLSSSIVRNPDGQIQSAVVGSDSIACKYTPDGDMILKTISDGTNSATEKYILDITGKYPVVLLVIDTSDDSITNEYFYADKDLLAQETSGEKYFYLKDRLGSVRAMIDDTGSIVNSYAYKPYGKVFEKTETIENRFQFASYQLDDTTELYYLNARWYDPVIQRFTSRDPVRGYFNQPQTLHQYLYCLNNPVNRIDPDGRFATWMRAKEASVKVGIQAWAFNKIQVGSTIANATLSGTINAMSGPSNVNRGALFAMGFMSGFIESTAYYKTGSLTLATSLGGAFQAGANHALSEENKISVEGAMMIGFGAGLGALEGFGLSKIPGLSADTIKFWITSRTADVWINAFDAIGDLCQDINGEN